MANKQLTATVRLNTTQAERKLKNIARAIDAINNAVGKEATAYAKVTAALGGVERGISRATRESDKLKKSADSVGKEFKEADKITDSLGKKLGALATTYISIQGLELLTESADTITKAQNKLNALEGGSPELTQEAMDKMYAASIRSRSLYSDMLDNVSKTMALAGDSFGGNIDNAIRFQEIMAKAYTLGGASEHEKSTSMYQLVQALGSGILQGDELRSVREGAPIAYKKIEEFAQGVLNTKESLKDLASQGVITSDIIVAAIMDCEKEVNAAFKDTKVTFEDTLNKFKSQLLYALQPALEELTKMLESDQGKKAINGITQAIVVLAKVATYLILAFGTFFNWCVDNWEWLKYVVLWVVTAIVAYWVYMKVQAIITAIAMMGAFATVFFGILIVVGGIMLILWAYEQWRQGSITTTEFIIWCLLAISIVALLLITIITGGTAALVAFIVAAVMWLLAVILYYFEEIAGGVWWLCILIYDILIGLLDACIWIINVLLGIFNAFCAMVVNFFVGTINSIIQLVWYLVEPIICVIEFILNACNGGFNSFGDACANLIGQIISWFLSLGKVVTKIIDAIFGTDWTSGLNSLQDSVLQWGKNEKAITISREAPEIDKRLKVGDEFMAGYETIDYLGFADLGSAYSTGAEWGAGVIDGINNWGAKAQNQDKSNNGLFTDLGKKLGLDIPQGSALDPLTGLPDPNADKYKIDDSYDKSLADDDIKNALDKLNGTTSDIADNMNMADDDLEYLRKIAEMEWRNEFTTAEIKVDMTNYNNVEGDRDLDGIVEYLGEALRAEMTSVAYGVHID